MEQELSHIGLNGEAPSDIARVREVKSLFHSPHLPVS